MNSFERIYEQWHLFAKTRDTENLINLYDDNATFESPLVPAILEQESGVLQGRAAILNFLQEGTKRRPNRLVRWYRNGTYFVTGDTLIWEYPRETPEGEQIDILEVMQIHNDKIVRHRIYWGWFGCQRLVDSAKKVNSLC
ncbi:nuclear transport factor 2 family protein [Pasteurellaceae bacterium LIM206]|nr:nuclear transport factor 2 family protein [Pasteurellaceae bacterium LIM206]